MQEDEKERRTKGIESGIGMSGFKSLEVKHFQLHQEGCVEGGNVIGGNDA